MKVNWNYDNVLKCKICAYEKAWLFARDVVHLFCGASVLYSLVAVLISCIQKQESHYSHDITLYWLIKKMKVISLRWRLLVIYREKQQVEIKSNNCAYQRWDDDQSGQNLLCRFSSGLSWLLLFWYLHPFPTIQDYIDIDHCNAYLSTFIKK